MNRMLRNCLVSFGLATMSVIANAQIDLNHAHRSNADKQRDMTSKPLETMALIDVKKGVTVLDLLGGSGYYSELLGQ